MAVSYNYRRGKSAVVHGALYFTFSWSYLPPIQTHQTHMHSKVKSIFEYYEP